MCIFSYTVLNNIIIIIVIIIIIIRPCFLSGVPLGLEVQEALKWRVTIFNKQQTCSIYPSPFSEACQRHAVNAINFCSENPLNIISNHSYGFIFNFKENVGSSLILSVVLLIYCWCSNKVHVLNGDCDISLMLNLQMCNIVVKRNELVVFF